MDGTVQAISCSLSESTHCLAGDNLRRLGEGVSEMVLRLQPSKRPSVCILLVLLHLPRQRARGEFPVPKLLSIRL